MWKYSGFTRCCCQTSLSLSRLSCPPLPCPHRPWGPSAGRSYCDLSCFPCLGAWAGSIAHIVNPKSPPAAPSLMGSLAAPLTELTSSRQPKIVAIRWAAVYGYWFVCRCLCGVTFEKWPILTYCTFLKNEIPSVYLVLLVCIYGLNSLFFLPPHTDVLLPVERENVSF